MCGRFLFGFAFGTALFFGEGVAQNLLDIVCREPLVASLAAELECGVHERPAFVKRGNAGLEQSLLQFILVGEFALYEVVKNFLSVFHGHLQFSRVVW